MLRMACGYILNFYKFFQGCEFKRQQVVPAVRAACPVQNWEPSGNTAL